MKNTNEQNFTTTGKISKTDSYAFDVSYQEPPELILQHFFYKVMAFFTLIFSWIALPFMRISFGERLFSLINVILVANFIFFFLDENSRLFDVYVFLGLFHFAWVVIRRRFFDHHWWYSVSYGISISYLIFSSILHPFLKGVTIPEKFYAAYIDPALFILASTAMYGYDTIMGKFLILGGLSLFFKEQINRFFQRQIILDQRDMEIWQKAEDSKKDKLGAEPSKLFGLYKGFRNYENTLKVSEGLKINTDIFKKKKGEDEKLSKGFNELQNNQAL